MSNKRKAELSVEELAEHRAMRNKYAREHRKRNLKEYRLRDRERYAANKDCFAERRASPAERERRRAYQAEYRAKNPEKIAAAWALWCSKNRLKRAAAYARKNASKDRITVHSNDLYRTVWAKLAETPLSYADRADIASETVLVILEQPGLPVCEAIRLAKRNHWRIHSKFQALSLDAVIPGTDNLRLIDRIAA